MEPRLALPSSQPLRIPAQYSVVSSSAPPPSSSAEARPRKSHGMAIDPTYAPNIAAAASPSALPQPSSSSQLLQEIEETRKLIRTFRLLKERGASRAELAELHFRVKALKAAQQCQHQNTRASKEVAVPPATSTTERVPPLSCAHHHAGIALHEEATEQTAGSSHGLHSPHRQPQRVAEEAHDTHRERRPPEGTHPPHRHLHHDVCVDRFTSLSSHTSPSTTAARAATTVRDGLMNDRSRGSAGVYNAVAPQPSTASVIPESHVRINSIVFAIALAEAHTRCEIVRRWERRWLRRLANFKEERIAIALRAPTTATAALSRPQLQPERWAEVPPMALPRELQHRQQTASTAPATVEGSNVAATTAAHTVRASPAPVPGNSTGEASTATIGRPAVEGLQETLSLSNDHSSVDEVRHVPEEQAVIPHMVRSDVEEDKVVWPSPLPQYQQPLAASAAGRDSKVDACTTTDVAAEELAATRKAAAAAEQLAAVVRKVEDEEAAARADTERTEAEKWQSVMRDEATARLRAEEARQALQSLAIAEAGARATLEDDESRLRVSFVAAAETESQRRADEERMRQEAAAAEQLAAVVRKVEDEEAAARADTERTEAEKWQSVMRDEATARLRAEEARQALQSLAIAEAGARATLEDDESRLRVSFVAAAETESQRRADEERMRQEAAARRAAEIQQQAVVDAEAAERCSVEQQWQDALCLSKSLLADQIKDTVAATLPLAHSKNTPASKRSPRVTSAMEDAQARERCAAVFSAAVDTVLEEWISAVAAEVEQSASAEASRRKEDNDAARAKAVAQERASAAEAARATVARAEEVSRPVVTASEEEAWKQLQVKHQVGVAAMRTADRVAEEESLRLQVQQQAAAARDQVECEAVNAQREAAAMTAALCSAIAELSKNLVDGFLVEAAQRVSEQAKAVAAEVNSAAAASDIRNRRAMEELQAQRRESVEGEEVSARDEMYGNALRELTRLHEAEASAGVCKGIEVGTTAAAKEPPSPQQQHQQQQRRPPVQAAVECFPISELSEALLLEFLRNAAAAAVSRAASSAVVAKPGPGEASQPITLPEKEEGAATAIMEDEQQHHHHQASADDAAEKADALTEMAQGSSVDTPDKAHVDTSAPGAMAASASSSLSPSSSADATPSAVTSGVSQGHADECVGLLSPIALVHVVDGLLLDVLHDATMEMRKGGGGAGGAINEDVACQNSAVQGATTHSMPLLKDSEAAIVTLDKVGLPSTFDCSQAWGLQPKLLEVPPALMVSDATGNHVPPAEHTGGESHNGAEADGASGGISHATLSLAEASDVETRTPPQPFVSPLCAPSTDVAITGTPSTLTTSPTGGKGSGCAGGAAGATATAPSPLHCSTASLVDDDDAVCDSFAPPAVPLPLNLQPQSVLSPLLCHQQAGDGGLHDDRGEASMSAQSEDTAGTTTTAEFVDRSSFAGNSGARQQLAECTETGDHEATPDADGSRSAVVTTGSNVIDSARDLRAFQLDASSLPHGVAETCARARIAASDVLTADAVAAVTTALVQGAVHDAALLSKSQGKSEVSDTDSNREQSHGAVKVDDAAAPSLLFSSARSHEQSTTEGNSSRDDGTSPTDCAGDEDVHTENKVSSGEVSSGVTSGDGREVTLRATRSLSTAAAVVAAEGIAGAHTPLESLSTLVSVVAAPNDLVDRLRQQEAEKSKAAYQQNRYLTTRELALVAARYLTSETVVSHVMDVGPTAMLSARSVALVLAVGLVRAATLENRRARHRVEEAEKEAMIGPRDDGSTAGDGVLVGGNGLQKRTPGSGTASAGMSSLDAPLPSLGSCGNGGDFPTGIIDQAGTAGDNEKGVDVLVSPATCDGSNDGDLAMSESAAASTVGNVAQASGKVKDIDMSGDPMDLGSRSPSRRSPPSFGSASQPTAGDDATGALPTNPAQQQGGVCGKLPADWAMALRGVAERVACDFIDYASRHVLIGQGGGQLSQDQLRTAQCIHSDALERVDVHTLFTHELQLRDVARLTSYYIELAANGPRDRVDPLCAPAVLGEHNIFGRGRSGAVGGDVAGFASSHPLSSRNNSLLPAATAIHVRRSGLLHLVLEQSVSNVLHDLVGDTVGWLWTACLQAAPPEAGANGAQ
ncbi:kinetoplast-associated protein-like protein [Leishmania tarentolae]|uniref:Kinetoplast-associated protein-like protein n=1 Tax=Leishmania tarentolae TaxID=5689 RepID=A0A640K9J9_LEITA|nr:kinetoplast-associated protein-like protein [Leishmania tarentolae]